MALGKTSAFTKIKEQDPLNGPLAPAPNLAAKPTESHATVGENTGTAITYAKKLSNVWDALQPKPTVTRSESAYQDQRAGERDKSAYTAPTAPPTFTDPRFPGMDFPVHSPGATPDALNADKTSSVWDALPHDVTTAPGVGGRFGGSSADLTSPGVGTALSGAGGLLNVIQGIRNRDPGSIISGAGGLYGAASSVAPETIPSISSLASNLAGTLGDTATSAATETAINGLGYGSLMSPWTVESLLNLGNSFFGIGDRRPGIIQEIKAAANNAPTVSGQLNLGASGFDKIAGADANGLRDIIDNSLQAQSGMGQMAAAVAAGNTRDNGIMHPDYSGLQGQANMDLPKAGLALIRAQDKLYNQGGNIRSDFARMGAREPYDTGERTPGLYRSNEPIPYDWGAFSLKDLAMQGVSQAGTTTEELAKPAYADIFNNPVPGQYERQLNDIYMKANPDLANTAWGKLQANTNSAPPRTGSANNLTGTLGFAGLTGPSKELKDADNPTRL